LIVGMMPPWSITSSGPGATVNEGMQTQLQVAPPQLPPSVRPSKVFDSYWKFAAERQEIFFRRIAGAPPPWTADPILREFKFTNAYRASDRVSQYLIKQVIYAGDQNPDELVFRILVFKMFNRIETWELLEESLGGISLAAYDFERYDSLLTNAMAAGERIYSAAYIMPSGGRKGDGRKHRDHLRLIERMMRDGLATQLQRCKSMQQGFQILKAYPMVGDFLAYQFITDINYSILTDFSEMEFNVPGPGARDGTHKCFESIGELSPADIIRMMADIQQQQFARLGLRFRSLWGRRLQLVDCQNLFCEVSKYARCAHPDVGGLAGRTRIKQKYRMDPRPLSYWYPPKWNINHI
jgi:alpha-glutamyl/putrescinyl thymine pyrophosphorylase clade 1